MTRSVFFNLDPTARQRLYRFSPNLHQQTSLWCYSIMVVPPWKSPPSVFGAPNVLFGARIYMPNSDGRCTKMRKNSGKSKTTVITTISGLPSHPSLVKFCLGEFELQGAHKLCIFANGPQRVIEPVIWKTATRTKLAVAVHRERKVWLFRRCIHFGDYWSVS